MTVTATCSICDTTNAVGKGKGMKFQALADCTLISCKVNVSSAADRVTLYSIVGTALTAIATATISANTATFNVALASGTYYFLCARFGLVWQTYNNRYKNASTYTDSVHIDILESGQTNDGVTYATDSNTRTEEIENFVTDYGAPNQTFVYVWDTATSKWLEVEGIEYFKVEKRLNQMSKFTINMPQVEAAQKLYVKEFAKVLLISNSKLVLKGRIQKVTYETSYSATIEGFGMEATILDKEYRNSTRSPDDEDRVQYDNVSAQTIAKELLSTNHDGLTPWTMTPSATGIFASDYGLISMRFEYANKLTALGNLANSIKYDWWIENDSTYANDTFNLASIKGVQTNPSLDTNRQFTITGALVNAEGTDYQKDVTNVSNYIKCYDEQTEVLTKNGFKFFKDVTLDDEIATLNPETEELEYHKPLAKQEYDYNGIMHHYKNMNVDLLVTPDHSLYCKKIWQKDFNRIESKEVFGKWLNFKKDCKWKGKSEDYFVLPKIENTWHCGKGKGHDKTEVYSERSIPINLWLEFMGWFLSEGNLHNNIRSGYKIRITQNYPNLNRIIELIKKMGYKPFICKNPDRIEFYDKQLYLYLKQFGKAKDKFIPNFIKNLSTEQIDLFLNILFEGDGCHNKKEEMTQYYSISKRLIEDVAELLLKTGRGFKFYYRNGCFSLSVNNHNLKCHMNRKDSTKENYSGKIYDLTIPNHIMFIRRNNTCVWSGNCQGYGDGINQLFTSTYSASPIWTTLSANIGATDATISLIDATSFAASGTVRIAEEIITYTGKAGNNLTGCTRGTSSSTAKVHRKGCYIEKYVVYTSPEANSSLSTNGLMELTLTYRDVLDESTLELIATNEMIDRMNPIERITVTPSEPYTVAETLQTGDLISIVDAESSLNSNYRIVGIIYESNYGDLSVTLEASNKSLTFIEQMQKEREKNQALQKYMQGSTNVYVVNNSENCDNGYGCVIKTYIPVEAIAINHVKLSYSVEAYRIYNTTTANESKHTHGIPSLNVAGSATTATNIGHTHTVTIPSHTHQITNLPVHQHLMFSWVSYPNGPYSSVDKWNCSRANQSGGTNAYFFSSYSYDIYTDGIAYYQGTSATSGGGGSSTPTSAAGGGSHSHNVNATSTASTTTTEGLAHNHGVNYGISTGSNTISDMQIFVDGTDRTTDIETALKHILSINSTESEIDLTSWIGSTGWHTIDIRPNGTCRINGDMWNQVFIEST